ncbi:MAG: uroporphyrinogen-III synthase [Candidatus Bathyarchaeota archaeon B63]|nr:MAG: uroporphyrinogen-III synthase [Candidatus Bathyarchaeota archaeon B63]
MVQEVRGRLALEGMTVAITRPEEEAGKLAELVSRLGGTPYVVPTIEIRLHRDELLVKRLLNRVLRERIDFIIFMSMNSVRSLIWYLDKLDLRGEFLRKMDEARVVAIGPKTMREIEEHGIRVDIVPSTYSSEGIIESLKNLDLQGRTAAILCSNMSRRYLPIELEGLGVKVIEVPIYECALPKDHSRVLRFIDDLLDGKIDVVTFTSPSTATNLFKIASKYIPVEDLRRCLRRTIIAAIGPVTRRTLEELGLKVDVTPKEHTIEAMVNSLLNHICRSKAND